MVWVNGHNLEELPYQVCVDLLRDPNIDVLSFVVIRQYTVHQLLLRRQYLHSRTQIEKTYHRFENELSNEEYYKDMQKHEEEEKKRFKNPFPCHCKEGCCTCSFTEDGKVKMKVCYSGPSTVITIPVEREASTTAEQNGDGDGTQVKTSFPANADDNVPVKYTSSKVLKLKRSESKGEIGSSKLGE